MSTSSEDNNSVTNNVNQTLTDPISFSFSNRCKHKFMDNEAKYPLRQICGRIL